MNYGVELKQMRPQLIAAVRKQVKIGEVAQAWKPALDQVWAFLRSNRSIKHGHNLFLYHHPARRDLPMDVDFGVEVANRFDGNGNVHCVETPAGEVAWARHIGPYDQLKPAHDAVHAWCAAHGRKIGDASWESYGDTTEDPVKLETTIYYLLA